MQPYSSKEKNTTMIQDFDKMLTENKSPFTVPDGYFDTLEKRIMQRIPDNEVRLMPDEKDKQPKITKIWKRYAAAAAIVAAVAGAALFMPHMDREDMPAPMAKHNNSANVENANVDAMADYIMADDYELYSYIADGDY